MRKVLVSLVAASALLVGGCGSSSSSSSSAAGAGPVGTTASSAPLTPSAPSSAGVGASGTASDAGGSDAGFACPTSNTTAFAKTKFVTHAGLGFGAFHRYLYKPYQAGAFTTGSTKSKAVAIAKAGAAALFIKRQVRLASEDVKANPTLCKAIGAPLAALGDSISGAVTKLKGGDPSGITAANSQIAGIESNSSRDGAPITEDQNATIS